MNQYASEPSLHLNVNLLNKGIFAGSWRQPETDPLSSYQVDHYIALAKAAEEAALDAVFLADTLIPEDGARFRPSNSLEPTVLLARLAAETSNIGLIGTVSTTYNDPNELAQRLAGLDFLSNGRLGWNVVTTAGAVPARNFGLDGELAREVRYRKAEDFVEQVLTAWKTGATVKSAQGYPLIVQAGGSPEGLRLAGRFADAVFSVAQTLEDSVSYSRQLEVAAAAAGRSRNRIANLPGLSTVVAKTERDARRRRELLDELVPTEYAVQRLSAQLGMDLTTIDLDTHPDVEELPSPEVSGGSRGFYEAVLNVIRRENPTYRQLLKHLGGGTGHHIVVGPPEHIADHIERWYRSGAVDGFNLMPDVLPEGFYQFTELVIPELRKRNLFRTQYTESTLRERYAVDVSERAAL